MNIRIQAKQARYASVLVLALMAPRFLTVGAVGNNPPAVKLQLSADTITAADSVTLTAIATDPDGAIAHVVFYDGSTRLAQVEKVPYSFVWQTASPGNHLLTARAVDDGGAETVSSPRLLTVSGPGKPLPTVSLSLSADRISAHGTVTLTATVTNLGGVVFRVEFYDGSTKLGEVEAAPYTLVWRDAPAGNHLLTARAIDGLGRETDSSPRFLSVGATPLPKDDHPKLSISAASKDLIRLVVSGEPGQYVIAMSQDLKTWVDIYPVTIKASGVAAVDDSGGPSHYARLFYRVRREP